ncbi:hypothetical protein VTN31DRAFT_4314 [Thermomyces dupontii]|uniref:uncharacterized protein n=1 Tax=Talaromyces thermophilus TaxID=28565 RepID=UPI003742F133
MTTTPPGPPHAAFVGGPSGPHHLVNGMAGLSLNIQQPFPQARHPGLNANPVPDQDPDASKPYYEGWTFYRGMPAGSTNPNWTEATRSPMHLHQDELARKVRERGRKIPIAEQYTSLRRQRRAHVEDLIREREEQDPRFQWSCVYVRSKQREVRRTWRGVEYETPEMDVIIVRKLRPGGAPPPNPRSPKNVRFDMGSLDNRHGHSPEAMSPRPVGPEFRGAPSPFPPGPPPCTMPGPPPPPPPASMPPPGPPFSPPPAPNPASDAWNNMPPHAAAHQSPHLPMQGPPRPVTIDQPRPPPQPPDCHPPVPEPVHSIHDNRSDNRDNRPVPIIQLNGQDHTDRGHRPVPAPRIIQEDHHGAASRTKGRRQESPQPESDSGSWASLEQDDSFSGYSDSTFAMDVEDKDQRPRGNLRVHLSSDSSSKRHSPYYRTHYRKGSSFGTNLSPHYAHYHSPSYYGRSGQVDIYPARSARPPPSNFYCAVPLDDVSSYLGRRLLEERLGLEVERRLREQELQSRLLEERDAQLRQHEREIAALERERDWERSRNHPGYPFVRAPTPQRITEYEHERYY